MKTNKTSSKVQEIAKTAVVKAAATVATMLAFFTLKTPVAPKSTQIMPPRKAHNKRNKKIVLSPTTAKGNSSVVTQSNHQKLRLSDPPT